MIARTRRPRRDVRRSVLGVIAALLCACGHPRGGSDEELRRQALVRDIASRESIQAGQHLASSPDVRFEWGFSLVEYDPKEDYHSPRALRWVGQRAAIRVRRHGDKAMKLAIAGWVNARVLRTKPAVSAYLDGQLLSSMPVEEINEEGFGSYQVGGVVPPEMFHGDEWAIVDIELSTIGFHWAEPPKLQVAFVSSVEWNEAERSEATR